MSDGSGREAHDIVNAAALVRVEGKVDLIKQALESGLKNVEQAVRFGDQQNSQLITFASEEVHRAHVRIDLLESRAQTNLRLVIASLIGVASVIVALVGLLVR